MLLDRDDDDCLELKDRMEQAAITSGMRTKSIAPAEPYVVVNRLAIEELEAWYFGDWTAVYTAYPRVSQSIPYKAKYRDPDAIHGARGKPLNVF